MLSVQILQQGNRILAGDSGQVLEAPHVESGRLRFLQRHAFAQIHEHIPMKDQIVRNLHQNFVTQQQCNNFLRPRLVDLQSRKHVLQCRHFQTSIRECRLDDLLRFGFFILHHHAATRQAHQLAGQFNFLRLQHLIEHSFKYLWRNLGKPSSQFLLAHAGNQGVAFMKSLESGNKIFSDEVQCWLEDEDVTDADNLRTSRHAGNNLLHTPARMRHRFRDAQALCAACRHAGAQNASLRFFTERLEETSVVGRVFDLLWWSIFDDYAATAGDHGRKLSNDEAVSRKQQRRFTKPQLRESSFARPYLLLTIQHDCRNALGSVGVEVHARAVFQRFCRSEQRQFDIHARARTKSRSGSKHHSTCQFFRGRARQVQSCPLAGNRPLSRFSMHLHSADSHPLPGGKNLKLVFFLDGAGNQSPCDHGAKAFHGEHAIDGQAHNRVGILRRNLASNFYKFPLQIVNPGPGQRTDGHHGVRSIKARLTKKRPAQEVLHFSSHHFQRFLIDSIRLGQDRDAPPHRKQAANIEVFASLRLDRFVRRNHQQHQIDATNSSQHIADKALMPRNIDEPQPQSFATGHGQLKIGEANVDGDPTALFFFKAISVDAGECLYQRSFAVVDVACGAYDDGLHSRQYSWDAAPSGQSESSFPSLVPDATIVFPHDHSLYSSHYSGNCSRARPHAGRIREDQTTSRRTRADHHRTGHFQRDVERALLLQIFARASETAAHPQPSRRARPGRERGHYRHRRWLGLRLQNRIAQPSIIHRAISGRSHGRRRNPPRHLHHGRTASRGNGFLALWPHPKSRGDGRPSSRAKLGRADGKI